MTHPPPDATLRSLTVGGPAKTELRAQLARAGVRLNTMAERLFDDRRFVTAGSAMVVRTWECSVGALGFAEGAAIGAILARAADRGLGPGPLELGPHMRLQYLDQPEILSNHPEVRHQAPSGSLTVASSPLTDDEDFPCGFYLRRIDGVPWLRGYRSGPDHLWKPMDRFVFVERP